MLLVLYISSMECIAIDKRLETYRRHLVICEEEYKRYIYMCVCVLYFFQSRPRLLTYVYLGREFVRIGRA
jgi:hypothetical protein